MKASSVWSVLACLAATVLGSQAASEGIAPAVGGGLKFAEVRRGTVDPGEGGNLVGWAVTDDGDVFASDAGNGRVLRLRSGSDWQPFGPRFKVPWDLSWNAGRLHVTERDIDDYGVVVLAGDGKVVELLDVSPTPGVGVLADGRRVVGSRQRIDDGNDDLIHVLGADGSLTVSMMPFHPMALEGAAFERSFGNAFAFAVQRDRIYALQAFDEGVSAFEADGRRAWFTPMPCATRRAASFTPPEAVTWGPREWTAWRDSWSRPFKLRVVGGDILVQSVEAVPGQAGTVDMLDDQGHVKASCVSVPGWMNAATGDLVLFTERGGTPAHPVYTYQLVRVITGDAVPQGRGASVALPSVGPAGGAGEQKASSPPARIGASRLPAAPLLWSDGSRKDVSEVVGSHLTLLILVHPRSCAACLGHAPLWAAAFAECASLRPLLVFTETDTVQELENARSGLASPYDAVADASGALREWVAGSDPTATSPYMLLVSGGEVLGRHSGSLLPEAQVRMVRAAIAQACRAGSGAR